jgi:hypothetical protein
LFFPHDGKQAFEGNFVAICPRVVLLTFGNKSIATWWRLTDFESFLWSKTALESPKFLSYHRMCLSSDYDEVGFVPAVLAMRSGKWI